MNPKIPWRLLASLLTSIVLIGGLGACGGGDDSKQEAKASATPAGIREIEVNSLKLDTPRAVVKKRFGEPVDPKGLVPARILKDEPKRLACSYYTVKGGVPSDFVQFCFKQGKLASKLSLIKSRAEPKGPADGT